MTTTATGHYGTDGQRTDDDGTEEGTDGWTEVDDGDDGTDPRGFADDNDKATRCVIRILGEGGVGGQPASPPTS